MLQQIEGFIKLVHYHNTADSRSNGSAYNKNPSNNIFVCPLEVFSFITYKQIERKTDAKKGPL